MNAWCNIWDRGFIRPKVSSFHLITTVCGLMEPQPDLQLGVTIVRPQTCDGTLKVQLKYLVSISTDGKLMSWCSVYTAVCVSHIWLPCVPRSSSFSGYAEKLCHHKSGSPLILFIRLQRKLMLVLPGYSFYMLKTPTPAVSYGKQKMIRTQTGNIIHMQLIIQEQIWCSASDRMIGELFPSLKHPVSVGEMKATPKRAAWLWLKVSCKKGIVVIGGDFLVCSKSLAISVRFVLGHRWPICRYQGIFCIPPSPEWFGPEDGVDIQ